MAVFLGRGEPVVSVEWGSFRVAQVCLTGDRFRRLAGGMCECELDFWWSSEAADGPRAQA